MTSKLLAHYERQLDRWHRTFNDDYCTDPSDEIHRQRSHAERVLNELDDATEVCDEMDNPIAQYETLRKAIDRVRPLIEAIK